MTAAFKAIVEMEAQMRADDDMASCIARVSPAVGPCRVGHSEAVLTAN